MGQAVYVCLRTIISSFEGDHPRIASDELVRKILVVSASETGIFGMPSTIRLSGGASESLCAQTDPAVRLNNRNKRGVSRQTDRIASSVSIAIGADPINQWRTCQDRPLFRSSLPLQTLKTQTASPYCHAKSTELKLSEPSCRAAKWKA